MFFIDMRILMQHPKIRKFASYYLLLSVTICYYLLLWSLGAIVLAMVLIGYVFLFSKEPIYVNYNNIELYGRSYSGTVLKFKEDKTGNNEILVKYKFSKNTEVVTDSIWLNNNAKSDLLIEGLNVDVIYYKGRSLIKGFSLVRFGSNLIILAGGLFFGLVGIVLFFVAKTRLKVTSSS